MHAEYWLTTQQAADYTGYSIKSITRFCRSGKLKHARSGGRAQYRFRKEWLDALLRIGISPEPDRTPRQAAPTEFVKRSSRLEASVARRRSRRTVG